MLEIHLIRHGQPAIDPEVMIGSTDADLGPEGLVQAEAAGEALKDWLAENPGPPLAALITSHLLRALNTAKITGRILNIGPVINPGFREVSLGAFEGLKSWEARARFPDEWRARGADLFNTAPPGGESAAEVAKRVLTALEAVVAGLPGSEASDHTEEHIRLVIVAPRMVIQLIIA